MAQARTGRRPHVGDATAFATPPELETIFREHGPYVWRTLRRLGITEPDADDLCQDVFLIVHRKLNDFEARSSLRTWLYGICVRIAMAHRRKARHRHEVTTEQPPDVVDSSNPDETIRRNEARLLLDRALETLDDDKRAVFVLYELEQLTMAQIAAVLQCPLQTAYSRLHSARDHVERLFRRFSQERSALERMRS